MTTPGPTTPRRTAGRWGGVIFNGYPAHKRPCGICGEGVLWATFAGGATYPVEYHDCKPVPGAKLAAAEAELARLRAEVEKAKAELIAERSLRGRYEVLWRKGQDDNREEMNRAAAATVRAEKYCLELGQMQTERDALRARVAEVDANARKILRQAGPNAVIVRVVGGPENLGASLAATFHKIQGQRDAERARLRTVNQAIVAEIGAAGPDTAEKAAARIVARLQAERARGDRVVALLREIASIPRVIAATDHGLTPAAAIAGPILRRIDAALAEEARSPAAPSPAIPDRDLLRILADADWEAGPLRLSSMISGDIKPGDFQARILVLARAAIAAAEARQ